MAAECAFGYPLEWFAETVSERFKCGICCQVLREPTSTKCGHVYCSQCISSWVSYYGVCPERCRELEMDSIKRSLRMDHLISGLPVHCKNKSVGCRAVVSLADKYLHEESCAYSRGRGLRRFLSKLSLSQLDLTEGRKYKVNHKRTKSSEGGSATRINNAIASTCKRSPSSVAALDRLATVPPPSPAPAMPVLMNSKGIYSVHIFRLKRTKTREPLGLVLVSGEKTPDGRPVNFLVKKVHPDTLGWKAGLQAEDRIVKVDNHDLTSISPPEAVARIKEKTLVTLTVHRGIGTDDHVYDEIFYSDHQLSQNLSQQSLSQGLSQNLSQSNLSQNLSQQDENTPFNVATSSPSTRHRGRLEETQRHPHHSPAPSRSKPVHRVLHHKSVEKGSKDSGLSSGSSTQEDKHAPPFRGRTRSQGSQGSQGSQWVDRSNGRGHCRIEGNYEVEDIYLQKNSTNQLGITLGYDTKSTTGQLVICEILPNGLAARNGRLRTGDIVLRVNEFEVHNPEEAILLFLEQDQDITLTVARPLKVAASNRLRTAGSTTRLYPEGTRPYPDNPHDNHSYALLDPQGSTSFRRVDSCGSLDARRHPSPVMGGVAHDPAHVQQMPAMGSEMRRTKSASSTSKAGSRKMKSRSPPARQPSPLVTDSQQPVYHVLQQPGSPQEVLEEQEPVYHILQQPGSPRQLISPQPPVYQVLQHPHSPSPPPATKQLPMYQVLEGPDDSFQHEEFRPICRTGSGGKTKGSCHNLHPRPGSTTPHHKHRIDTTEGGSMFAPHSTSTHAMCPPEANKIESLV